MTIRELTAKIAADGGDIRTISGIKPDSVYYEEHIWAFASGLASIHYITAEDVKTIREDAERKSQEELDSLIKWNEIAEKRANRRLGQTN